jgi:cell division transport system permease protein
MRIKYVLSEVLTGLWRNVTMTIAMIITMAVSLTLVGASLLMFMQVNLMKDFYYEQIEVTIFLKNEATQPQKDAIGAALNSDSLVEKSAFETRDQAYSRFSEIFKDAPDLVSSTKVEALPESYRVKLKDPGRFDEVDAKYKTMEGVDEIVDQKALLSKVFSVISSLQKLSLIIAIVQGAAALLLVINTIQVAAYSKRREVAVMKLVGASNWFIQAPFVLEAVAAGLVGAIIAYGILICSKIFVIDGTLKPLTTLLLDVPWSNVHIVFPAIAGLAVLISSVTGWVALRFYIKV